MTTAAPLKTAHMRFGFFQIARHLTTDQASKRPEHFVCADGNDGRVGDPSLFVALRQESKEIQESNRSTIRHLSVLAKGSNSMPDFGRRSPAS
jgi:hypothetical protein